MVQIQKLFSNDKDRYMNGVFTGHTSNKSLYYSGTTKTIFYFLRDRSVRQASLQAKILAGIYIKQKQKQKKTYKYLLRHRHCV